MWCQNSFIELLFRIKLRYECDMDLHDANSKFNRFIDYCDEDENDDDD